MWNKQTFSIDTDGLSAITGGELTTVMGALVIDLVSAPIIPGTYDIRLNAVMGGIQLFLPAYARVQVNGETFWAAIKYIVMTRFGRRCRRRSPIPRSMCRRLDRSGQQHHMRNIRLHFGLLLIQPWAGHKFTSWSQTQLIVNTQANKTIECKQPIVPMG